MVHKHQLQQESSSWELSSSGFPVRVSHGLVLNSVLGVASVAESGGCAYAWRRKKFLRSLGFERATLHLRAVSLCLARVQGEGCPLASIRGASWLASPAASSKDSFFSSFLGEDSSWLVLGIRVVGQLWRTWGYWTLKDGLLEVIEDCRILLGYKGDSYTTLASSSCSTNAVNVICKEKNGEFIKS